MAEEIKYIPYGADEINYNLFITNAANEVTNYVNSQPWSNKRKLSFLNAYLDLVSKGIIGANNSSGMWKINYGGDPVPLETLSNRDREMYGEAAYFLQLQMSRIPTRASLEKEKEDNKIDLPVLDNKYFTSQIESRVANDWFGGRDWKNSTWNELDKRGENGLRGLDVRKEKLAKSLKNFLQKFDDTKVNFEGSPFENSENFKTKINDAISALDGNDNDLIRDKLNQIGLDYDDYLSNGGNDPVTLRDGTTTTYGEWAKYLDILKAKEEEEAQKKAEALARANLGVLSISSGNNPIDAIHNTENYNKWLALTYGSGQQGFEKINLLIQTLLEKSYNLGKSNGLNLAERKLLGNLIHYVRTNNPKYLNYNLTPEEEGELSKHNSMKGRRLQDFVRLPWQIDGRYTYADKSGNIYFLKSQNKKQLLQLAFTKSAEYNNYIKNFGKTQLQINNEQSAINMNTPLSLMSEWTPEMKKEIEAIAWDAASILDPEAFSGSAMALYASHLRDEANPNRGTLEKWFDRGTAALGGILGVGDLLVTGKLGYRLYQLGKSIGSVSKFAGILGAGFGAIGAFEARDSIAKIANPDSLTPKDLENIAYGLMGLIGLKSFAKARNKQTIGKQANPTTTEYNITVKDKNNKTHEIKIDEAAAKEILLVRTLGKKKETVDSEILNMPKIKESIQKYKEANPTKKLEIEGASIVNDSKSAFGISGRNKLVTSNQVKNPNAPEYVPVGNKWYSPFGYMALGNNKWGYYLGGGWQRKAWENAAPEKSSKGLWLGAKEFWNPEPKIKNETSSIKPSTEPKIKNETSSIKPSTETPKTKSVNTELYNKNTLYEYNILNTPNKNNSKLLLKGDSLSATLADGNTYRFVYSNEGEAIVMLNGKPILNPVKVKNLKEAKEVFSKFVKDLNSKIVNLNLSLFLKRFESKYLENIRELKRKGFFLKQGGTIDNLDTEIKEILKTL